MKGEKLTQILHKPTGSLEGYPDNESVMKVLNTPHDFIILFDRSAYIMPRGMISNTKISTKRTIRLGVTLFDSQEQALQFAAGYNNCFIIHDLPVKIARKLPKHSMSYKELRETQRLDLLKNARLTLGSRISPSEHQWKVIKTVWNEMHLSGMLKPVSYEDKKTLEEALSYPEYQNLNPKTD